ncbi:MAG: hypothetical protein IKL35_09300 [Muribaculaceae bacterium]|nr:hypothetical protein [Muribaculaceae bacterium]
MERAKYIILTILDYIGVVWFIMGAADILNGSSLQDFFTINNRSLAMMLIGTAIIKLVFRNNLSEKFYCLIITAMLLLNSIGLKIDLSQSSNIVINCISFIFAVISWYRFLRFSKFIAKDCKAIVFLSKYISKIAVALLLIQCVYFVVTYGICLETIVITIILLSMVFVYKTRIFPWLYYLYSTSIIGMLITIFYYNGIDFQNYAISNFYPFDDFILYLVPNIICATMCVVLKLRFP